MIDQVKRKKKSKYEKQHCKYMSWREESILNALESAERCYMDLPSYRADEAIVFRRCIEKCKDLIAVRVARKAAPDWFKWKDHN